MYGTKTVKVKLKLVKVVKDKNTYVISDKIKSDKM